MNDKVLGRPIRCNKRRLNVHEGHADVTFIGDVHFGSPQCDIDRFCTMIEYCNDNNRHVFLMGDLIECSTRHSVGAGVYEQTMTADSQHELMVEWLRPLAEKGLIIGSISGNHEARVYKETGVNIGKALCRELKIPYLGEACWNTFQVGKQNYSIYTLHGTGGCVFDGTALLKLERLSASFFGDAVCMGHVHKCISSIVLMQKVVDGRVVEHRKHLVITGSYLDYDKSYGQSMGLPISKKGSPRLRFHADKHDVEVTW